MYGVLRHDDFSATCSRSYTNHWRMGLGKNGMKLETLESGAEPAARNELFQGLLRNGTASYDGPGSACMIGKGEGKAER